MRTRWLLVAVSFSLLTGPAFGQDSKVPAGEKEPFLRVETGGHMAYITAVAFSPDGKTLYSAGHDKVVRAWTFDGQQFKLSPQAFRVPIGPGQEGVINALAVSPDGDWLAVGGMSAARDIAGFRMSGIIFPVSGAMSPAMWEDRGTIYLFNTRTGQVRELRGVEGAVLTLAFAPPYRGKDLILASASEERDLKANKYIGRVRLWDVNTGKLIESMRLDRPALRPGLAVRHLGQGLRQLRVAIAWGDGTLRVWQLLPERDGDLYDAKDLAFNTAVAFVPTSRPGEARILTGGSNGRVGQLRWWTDRAGKFPELEQRRAYEFSDLTAPEVYLFPQNLDLLRPKAGVGPAQAAVVVAHATLDAARQRLNIRRFTLHVANLNQPGAMVEADLWNGSDMPALAVQPGGAFLAVAGDSRTHNIRLFPVPLRPGVPPIRLHGVGTTFRDVAFATNARKELGLILGQAPKDGVGSPPRPIAETDLAFHIRQRRLTQDPRRDWKIVAPDLDGWNVAFTQRDEQIVGGKRVAIPAKFMVTHGDTQKRIVLRPSEEVNDYALLPPMNGINTAILAVASWDLDPSAQEPLLYLYRVDTGEKVRQLKGHVERIRSIAFSPDGRLLASACEDQTVGVWTLSNLDRVLDRRGLIRGLAVRNNKEDQTVRVAPFREPSPAEGKVNAGNVVEAVILPNEKVVPVKKAMDYYLTIFQVKPRETVRLRVRDEGQVKQVNLVVGQGIDERKPLFSLFVTDGEDGKPREWIGWSPVGPYDASGARAEQYLGWHFNTGDEAKPTTFAPAGQYRKQYYKEGILRYLVARGNPADAVKDWENDRPPPPRPVMTPSIDESGPTPKQDAQGRILVQGTPATLRLGIDNVDPDDIESVKWQFDAGQLQDFTGHERGDWFVDLSKQNWEARPDHSVRVVLRLKRDSIKEHVAMLPLRYQPPAPVVHLDKALEKLVRPEDGQVLRLPEQKGKDEDFRLQAEVIPTKGQDVIVTLLQNGKEVVLGREVEKIDQKLKLQPGENWIELRARNAKALKGFEEFETTVWQIAVTYQPPEKVIPPEIVLSEVRFGPGENDAVKIVPERPVVVHRRKVRLLGTIKAKNKLTDVERDGRAIAGFEGKDKLALDEIVTLDPQRPIEVRLSAKTENGMGPAKTSVTIVYRPEPPRIVVKKAGPREVVKGAPVPKLELEVELVPPADKPAETKYTATLLLEGKKLPVQLTDEKVTAALDLADVQLKPGENVAQLTISDQWGSSTTEKVLHVLYRRPPRIVSIDQPAGAATGVALKQQFLDTVVARVESEKDLRLTRAEVNGHPATFSPVDGNPGLWKVEAKNLPLPKEGKNPVTVRVWNEDGEALAPRTFTAEVKLPKRVNPPVVRFTDPLGTSVIVTVPAYDLRFTVQSEEKLQAVELRRGDEVVRRYGEADLKKNPAGAYEVTEHVALKSGANGFQAIAVNEGGEGRATPVTISYTPPPVHFEFTRVALAEPPNKELKPDKDNPLRYGKATGERLIVEGAVVWPDAADPRLKQEDIEVRGWVNGFQQLPVRLTMPTKGDPRRREFKAEVGLNQAEGNRVEFALPEVPQEAGVRGYFLVDCAKPEPPKTFHVLVIGVSDKNAQQLEERVRKVVRAQPNVRGAFNVKLYGPLTDDVSPEKVYAQLRLIKKKIDTRAQQGSANDVLMVYYIGEESVKSEGHFFTTDVSQNDPELRRSGLSVERLRDSFLADTLGARVVLLDVAREEAPTNAVAAVDRVAQWTDKGRVGILRYSYQSSKEGAVIPAEYRLLTAWNKFLDSNKGPQKPIILDDVVRDVSKGFKQGSSDPYPRSTEYKGLTETVAMPAGLGTLPVEEPANRTTKP